MQLKIGDTVTWESAAGHLTGRIADIYLGLNEENKTIPWLVIKYKRAHFSGSGLKERNSCCRLAGTELNLKMMNIKKVENA